MVSEFDTETETDLLSAHHRLSEKLEQHTFVLEIAGKVSNVENRAARKLTTPAPMA